MCVNECNCLNFKFDLTDWGRVKHICVSKLTIIGSDNGLSPGRCQAIIWTNAGILLTGPLGTNYSEILIKIHIFSFKKMHWKMSSGKCQPCCLGLNVSNSIESILEDLVADKFTVKHLKVSCSKASKPMLINSLRLSVTYMHHILLSKTCHHWFR